MSVEQKMYRVDGDKEELVGRQVLEPDEAPLVLNNLTVIEKVGSSIVERLHMVTARCHFTDSSGVVTIHPPLLSGLEDAPFREEGFSLKLRLGDGNEGRIEWRHQRGKIIAEALPPQS